jgi:hypothetical protein
MKTISIYLSLILICKLSSGFPFPFKRVIKLNDQGSDVCIAKEFMKRSFHYYDTVIPPKNGSCIMTVEMVTLTY